MTITFSNRVFRRSALALIFLLSITSLGHAQYQMENLDRGLVSVHLNGGNLVSWRLFGTDPESISFNVYRNGTKVNAAPVTTSTNYWDNNSNAGDNYVVRPVMNGSEMAPSKTVTTWDNYYKTINLNRPPGGTTPANEYYDYSPNDATVADLDGDGEYEIIFKWYPSNAHDNAHNGYTGNTYIEAIKLDGTSMWRIDLGINIRSGAHYVEMQAYDFDGDGKAEVALKTADGTRDGKGIVIGNASADYRSSAGRILSGPEYLTMFSGLTGEALSTVNYVPARGSVSSWGDNYGNRVDRFLSGVAYLDGQRPSLLMCRGYYTRMVVAAWDFRNGQLQQRWVFDTDNGYNSWRGKGNHQISIADIDNDGKQEVIYGAVTIDDDGSGMVAQTWGHGDALHCGDFDLDNPGLEIFMPIETASSNPSDQRPGFVMRDARTGSILWQVFRDGDIGRGNCANIDPNHPGVECYASGGAGLYDSKGNVIGNTPSGCNFSIWWDGDLTRELLDGTKLDDWNTANGGSNNRQLTIYQTGAESINGTKANPNLSGDILGDWREEMIYRHYDNDKLIIYTTPFETSHRLYTLMHDPQYRMAIAWQSTGYNQPPHPSFYIGDDMTEAPDPDIVLVGNISDCNGDQNGTAYLDDCNICVGGNTGKTPCVLDCNGDINGTATIDNCGTCSGGNTGIQACTVKIEGENFCTADGFMESTNTGFVGTGYLNFDNAINTSAQWTLISDEAKTVSLGIRYANGAATARPMNLLLNDQYQATINGDPTANWTDWQTGFVTISLSAGSNVLTLTATTADGGPNIDLLSMATAGISQGGCTPDCRGDLGGTATIDKCDVCSGGKTGITPNSTCTQDCNQEWNGTASVDDCGECSGGSTGITPNSTCTQDCNNEWGGTASIDDCNICSGGSTGIPPNSTCTQDCNGEWNGTAMIDNCGVCSGGTTGITACTGSMEGEDFCEGDGIEEATNAGFYGTGYFNYHNATGTSATWTVESSVDQTVTIGLRYANGSFNARPLTVSVNGTGQATFDGNPTATWSTWETGFFDITLQTGTNVLTLTATSNEGGPNVDLFSFTSSTLSAGSCTQDCFGEYNGTATVDNCGECSGGSTGISPNSTCTQDCNNEWNGTASIDNCNVCSGGSTGITPNSTCAQDCNNEWGGTASLDDCNVCSGGNTGITPNSTCTQDCHGVRAGTAYIDDCNECVGGNTGKQPCGNDCAGVPGGSAYLDNCTTCVEGTTGLTACTQDCNSDWGGTAFIDSCGICAGGNTGITAVLDDQQCITIVDPATEESISIYPNPTNGMLHISIEADWELYSTVGKKLEAGTGQHIDLSAYASGVYFLKTNGKIFQVWNL